MLESAATWPCKSLSLAKSMELGSPEAQKSFLDLFWFASAPPLPVIGQAESGGVFFGEGKDGLSQLGLKGRFLTVVPLLLLLLDEVVVCEDKRMGKATQIRSGRK